MDGGGEKNEEVKSGHRELWHLPVNGFRDKAVGRDISGYSNGSIITYCVGVSRQQVHDIFPFLELQ